MTELLITEREAAGRLGISSKTLCRLRKRGEIAFVKIGHSIRYSPDALHQLVASLSKTEEA